MGACASAPKANKGDETAVAPPPEQPKEETPVTEAVAEAATTEGGDEKKEEKAEESEQGQSPGNLLVEGEAPREKVGEESTAEALPISEPAALAEEKSTVAATPQPAVVAA